MSLGARIRRYRSARGYTLDELAERMGGIVTKQALSKYEHGAATPRPTVLITIAEALGVSGARLVGEPEYRFEVQGFRALASLPKKERERIEDSVQVELERRLMVLDRLGLEHEYAFEGLEIPVADVAEAERAAEAVRSAWNLGGGPVASMVDTLESKGVHLVDVATERKFDGLAVVASDDDGKRVACGIASRREVSRSRQRMNHAHEVGHLAMRVTESADEELAARRFGGAFLFPEAAVRTEFGERRKRITADELFSAKQRWGISIQAVLYRLHDLNVLDSAGYSFWCMRINQAGWRTTEPGESAPERSTWMDTYGKRAAAEGLIAAETLAEYAPASRTRTAVDDIDRRALMRLPAEDRRAILRRQAEEFAAEYASMIDKEWLDADLGERGGEDE